MKGWLLVRIEIIKKLYYLFNNKIIMIFVGSKNSTTSAHFVLGSRPAPRREKWPRTDKESPNGLEMLPRTILLSTSQIPRGKNSTPAKAASQSAPRRRTSTVGYPWAYGAGAVQGETITSALNAPN